MSCSGHLAWPRLTYAYLKSKVDALNLRVGISNKRTSLSPRKFRPMQAAKILEKPFQSRVPVKSIMLGDDPTDVEFVKVVDEDLFKPVLPGGRPEITSKMLPAAILESTSRCELLIAACHMLSAISALSFLWGHLQMTSVRRGEGGLANS